LIAPPVDDHLRDGTEFLRDEYILARETTFPSAQAGEWFDHEIGRLEGLRATFDRRWVPTGAPGTVQGIASFPGVTAILGATGLSVGVIAISNVCFCNLTWVVPLVVAWILCFVGFLGFDEAEKLLEEENVYASEAAAYAALGVRAPSRHGHWTLIWAAIALVWWIATAIEHRAVHEQLFVNSRAWLFWVVAGLATAVAVVLFLRDLLRARQARGAAR
jgi:hypothetical protein